MDQNSGAKGGGAEGENGNNVNETVSSGHTTGTPQQHYNGDVGTY